MAKWVYSFGGGSAEGSGRLVDLLGGKGANLAEMSILGLPVPPGFTVTTDVCAHVHAHGRRYPDGLRAEVEAALAQVGRLASRAFGDADAPLLVSVRSGARASMPGMMDTVLNLGLNDRTAEALARSSGDPRFAYDSYRRFIQMYADVVLGLDRHGFEDILEDVKDRRGAPADADLDADDWRGVVERSQARVADETGAPFPQDPHEQLWGALGAVFSSWMSARAVTYRRLNAVPEACGTAVTVQAMVFGNMGDTSATGVAFTRNPSTGANALYGEFLTNAQGEDVVAGIRTPGSITEAARARSGADEPSMERAMPAAFAAFTTVASLLERHFRDMQDIEFTVERGKLWLLQTRSGKRTAHAALKIAVEMADAGLITRAEAVARIDPASLDQLLRPTVDPDASREVLATGLPASPGAARGEVVFTSAEAERLRTAGRRTVLVRVETSPEDVGGLHAAEGVLTARGGMTSHAAVVARGMGKPCVTGAGSVRIDAAAGTFAAGGVTVKAGEVITLDGSTGQVLRGAVALREPELSGDFARLMDWADGVRRMGVRTDAETSLDARAARRFGAEGIGLCRTERMFLEPVRLTAMRAMILAGDEAGRRAALAELLPMQRADFADLFTAMAGLPVAVRLLDSPLHGFLPRDDAEMAEAARVMGSNADVLRARAQALRETNPMLGLRGCRLALRYPEIVDMQVRAILEGAAEARAATGRAMTVEIVVPRVLGAAEFDVVKARVDAVAAAVAGETGAAVPHAVGAMIGLPRVALRAGEIAGAAAFLSFETTDLTQTALGISGDDAASFLGLYTARGLLPADPFATLDREGVGELVRIAAARGRAVRPDLVLGLCGEHGGDPASVAFCEEAGLDYVSCSPYRVPVARLAAAQASLEAKRSSHADPGAAAPSGSPG